MCVGRSDGSLALGSACVCVCVSGVNDKRYYRNALGDDNRFVISLSHSVGDVWTTTAAAATTTGIYVQSHLVHTQHGADAGLQSCRRWRKRLRSGRPCWDSTGVRVSASVWACWCTGLRSGIMSKGYAISEMHFATNSGGGEREGLTWRRLGTLKTAGI